MKICFNDLLFAVSFGFDCVEHDLIGVTTNHSKRVAYISIELGRSFGLTKEEISDLAGLAILHDNALTEYVQEEYKRGQDILKNQKNLKLGTHCVYGERNIAGLPFFKENKNVILYHHENVNGTGPFQKKEGEIPFFASLIHIADHIDSLFDFSFITNEKYERLKDFLKKNVNVLYPAKEVSTFLDLFDLSKLSLLKNEKIDMMLRESLPMYLTEYSVEQIMAFGSFFAKIIDFKSNFTGNHSIEIAKKAYLMGEHYGFDEETKGKLFLAGALHDIGKLAIDVDVLEKPAKLTENEYAHIKNHAFYTYDILRKVTGLSEITSWASLHHEKLNGKGYPFGYKEEKLGFMERLMACLDIYQALTEKRPYKDGMNHTTAMDVLRDMAASNYIDKGIVEDLDKVFRFHGEDENFLGDK